MKRLHAVRNALGAVAALLGFGLLAVLAWEYVVQPQFKPVAYRNVQIVEQDRADGWLYVAINADLEACERKDFAVVGKRLGATEFLPWRGRDGVPDDYDRAAGQQTVRGKIYVGSDIFDWIEIRTQHMCDGQMVDGVFARFENVGIEE